jgi:hypothetical protein
MLKELFIPVSVVVGLLTAVPTAQGHASRLIDYRSHYPNSDFYLHVPPYTGVNCGEARSILQRKGYRILQIIQCGGNYHKFKAYRRGFQLPSPRNDGPRKTHD